MIFDDHLLSSGEAGGRKAANLLSIAVKGFVQNSSDAVAEYKIVARMYANLEGLANVCHRSGLIGSTSLLHDFARGFTGSKSLFDFVDVGSGKDRADEKISGKIIPDDMTCGLI